MLPKFHRVILISQSRLQDNFIPEWSLSCQPAGNGHAECVQLLLAYDPEAQIKATDKVGMTA